MRSIFESQTRGRELTFLAGGWASSPFTAGGAASASFSDAVRFLPRAADFGFSLFPASPSSPEGLGFLVRGLAGAFFGGGSGLAWSLMREERRGSPASIVAAAPLRAIQRWVWRKDRGMVVWREVSWAGSGTLFTLFNVKPCRLSFSSFQARTINRLRSHDPSQALGHAISPVQSCRCIHQHPHTTPSAHITTRSMLRPGPREIHRRIIRVNMTHCNTTNNAASRMQRGSGAGRPRGRTKTFGGYQP